MALPIKMMAAMMKMLMMMIKRCLFGWLDVGCFMTLTLFVQDVVDETIQSHGVFPSPLTGQISVLVLQEQKRESLLIEPGKKN